jgi:hypothetical protein
MHHSSSLKDFSLARLILGIQKETSRFELIHFFLVLRDQNSQADRMEKEEKQLGAGTLTTKWDLCQLFISPSTFDLD